MNFLSLLKADMLPILIVIGIFIYGIGFYEGDSHVRLVDKAALAKQEQKVLTIERNSDAINQEISMGFASDIASIGVPATNNLSKVSKPAAGTNEATCDKLLAKTQAFQLLRLQQWVKEQKAAHD